MTDPRYYVHEFMPGRYHVCDRENHNLPVHDDDRDGNDKPLNFRDGDAAAECADAMNEQNERNEE